MGIYIKGMEMPKNCRGYSMATFHMNCGETRCRATNKILAKNYGVIQFEGRADFCPLVGIPEPHGDLIDRDALEADICPEWNGLYVPDNAYSEKLICNAPTVIPREDGEKHEDCED